MCDVLFIINNAYQAIQARQQINGLCESRRLSKIVLLCSPKDMERTRNALGSASKCIVFQAIIPSHSGFFRRYAFYLSLYLKLQALLPRTNFKNIIFFTELEIGNHIIVRTLQGQGTSVFLLEDGGLASYILLDAPLDHITRTAKNALKLALVKLLPKMGKSQAFKLNHETFFKFEDTEISGFLSYLDVRNVRDFPVHTIHRMSEQVSPVRSNSVLFLSEPLYEEYCSVEEYIHIVTTCVKLLCKHFGHVQLKFHPRETSTKRELVTKQLKRNDVTVTLVDDETPAEELIVAQTPEAIASLAAAPLLFCAETDVKVIYMFDAFDELLSHETFRKIRKILIRIGYIFPNPQAEEPFANAGFVVSESKKLSLTGIIN